RSSARCARASASSRAFNRTLAERTSEFADGRVDEAAPIAIRASRDDPLQEAERLLGKAHVHPSVGCAAAGCFHGSISILHTEGVFREMRAARWAKGPKHSIAPSPGVDAGTLLAAARRGRRDGAERGHDPLPR